MCFNQTEFIRNSQNGKKIKNVICVNCDTAPTSSKHQCDNTQFTSSFGKGSCGVSTASIGRLTTVDFFLRLYIINIT